MTQVVTHPADRKRARVQTLNEDPSETELADAHLADIRHVLQQYEQSGVLVDLTEVDLTFKDVSQFEDYVDMMRQLKDVEQEFMRLDPRIRSVFENDPAKWLDAAHDGVTAEQAEKLVELGALGRAVDPTPPEPQPVVIVEPPAE